MSISKASMDSVQLMRKFTKTRTSIDYRAEKVYMRSTLSFKENLESVPQNPDLKIPGMGAVSLFNFFTF
jgi:G:T-mismatch repair DNA endonuclease (very short patch repair protein)